MRGVYHKFLWSFPGTISHEHGDDDHERSRRYRVGETRLAFLRRHAEAFAYRAHEGEQVVAFLAELDEADLGPEMPTDIRYEYLAGSVRADGSVVLFSYIWFTSLAEVKAYALRHAMRIEGGWSDGKN